MPLVGLLAPTNAGATVEQPADTTARVSIAPDGTPGNGDSNTPAFSADVTTSPSCPWLPTSSTGGESDGGSFAPSMDADGGLVAFASDASNLSEGEPTPHRDIYVRNRGAVGSCLHTAWEDLGRAPLTDRSAIPSAHRFNVDCAVHHVMVGG